MITTCHYYFSSSEKVCFLMSDFVFIVVYIFFSSIGGHAKTLMFVHINPDVNAYGETISTLKFAERVASIELGAARFNKETGEIRELKDEVCTYFTGHLVWGGINLFHTSENVVCLAS